MGDAIIGILRSGILGYMFLFVFLKTPSLYITMQYLYYYKYVTYDINV